MKILIQDIALRSSYLLEDEQLQKFIGNYQNEIIDADLIFILPSNSMVNELPQTSYCESPILKIAIVDPDNNKIFNIAREDLNRFEVQDHFYPDSDTVSFSIPSTLELVEQVDLFRRALVQNSS